MAATPPARGLSDTRRMFRPKISACERGKKKKGLLDLPPLQVLLESLLKKVYGSRFRNRDGCIA